MSSTPQKIAIVGAGNVGQALSKGWQKAGHQLALVARDAQSPKTQTALALLGDVPVLTLSEATQWANIILISVPADAVNMLADDLKGYEGIVIDATNSIRPRTDGYETAWHYLDATLALSKLIKCFNTTGAENMANPVYHGTGTTMLLAGHDEEAKAVVTQLALDLGFGECLDLGGVVQPR